MNPITHLLAAWVVADRTQSSDRDIALVSWAGEAPDLDGLGALGKQPVAKVGGAGRMGILSDPPSSSSPS